MSNSVKQKVEEGVISHALDGLFEIMNNMGKDEKFDIQDLNYVLFMEDVSIIGKRESEEWIKKNNVNPFDLIRLVQKHEQSTFGRLYTEVDVEDMVNSYIKIKGATLLEELEINYSNPLYSKNQITDLFLKIKSMLG